MQLRVLVALALGTVLSGSSALCQSTHNVPGDYGTIQEAIDFASDGDVIIVEPGTYVENIDFLTKAVTVMSTDPLDPAIVASTVIDGSACTTGVEYCSVVRFVPSTGPDSILNGFTVTGGFGSFSGFFKIVAVGGGIYCSSASPTIMNCTISGNTADGGGGMWSYFSAATLTNCTISGNTSGAGGGGMANDYPPGPAVTNCIISGNTAGGPGGGMTNAHGSSPTLTNCTIAGNLAGSSGGAVWDAWGGSLLATNSILWGNAPGEIESVSGTTEVTFSDIQGGYPGAGNIDLDPLFLNPSAGDFRLLSCSPAIDAGDNTAPNLPATDFEGDPRIDNGTVDMGVDEVVGGPTPCPDGTLFSRGDSDSDGIFNAISDALFLLAFGFLGGPAPLCLESAEADGDGTLNALADGLYILTHGFLGGPPPSAPYPSCGVDPDPASSLGCDMSTCP